MGKHEGREEESNQSNKTLWNKSGHLNTNVHTPSPNRIVLQNAHPRFVCIHMGVHLAWDTAQLELSQLSTTPLARQDGEIPLSPCFNARKSQKVRILLTPGLQLTGSLLLGLCGMAAHMMETGVPAQGNLHHSSSALAPHLTGTRLRTLGTQGCT